MIGIFYNPCLLEAHRVEIHHKSLLPGLGLS